MCSHVLRTPHDGSLQDIALGSDKVLIRHDNVELPCADFKHAI